MAFAMTFEVQQFSLPPLQRSPVVGGLEPEFPSVEIEVLWILVEHRAGWLFEKPGNRRKPEGNLERQSHEVPKPWHSRHVEPSRYMPIPDGHHVFGSPGHELPEESVHLARCGATLFVDVRHHGSVVGGYHHFLVTATIPEVLEG